jgi:hypothetical protein
MFKLLIRRLVTAPLAIEVIVLNMSIFLVFICFVENIIISWNTKTKTKTNCMVWGNVF